MKKTYYIFIILFLLVSSKIYADNNSFEIGEKLVYEIKWGVITAANLTLEVNPCEPIENIPVYHFVMSVKTSDFIDYFYKVRSLYESYTAQDLSRSFIFKKKQREGSTKREVIVNFDWNKKEASYSNFGKKEKITVLNTNTLDPLAILYFCRIIDLKEKTTIQRWVCDGKDNILSSAQILKRETKKIGIGSFDTYLIEPDLKSVGGVFKKTKNPSFKMWVTADEKRTPVFIQSKVIVGSFVVELVAIESIEKNKK
ncbi:MAG: DUF3108 domain-containing protein [Desulfobacterales bacterium]|nr:DUF3108 domain-containing protein [Desulfobacterales bacterium]